MAERDETPKFNPKHRIVGAIIVVALAVIFVPLLLDREEPPAELKTPVQGAATSPADSREAGATRVVVAPVAESVETPPRPAAAVSPPPALPQAAEARTPLPVPHETPTPEAKPAASKPAANKPVKERDQGKEQSAPAEKIDKGWILQVGVFKDKANADRLRARLKEHGISASVESVSLDGSRATRLRVGPYRERAAALKMQARIKKDVSLDTAVYAYP